MSGKKVAIVDYNMGNLDSVARAVEECSGTPLVTNQARDFETANFIILPGVGSFGVGMKNIRQLGLEDVLGEQVLEKKVPFLGLCLGTQLLATRGWEGQETPGLGWIKGEVKRLERIAPETRIPHVGWNEVTYVQDSPLFADIPSNKDFYFVHSYHLVCSDEQDVIARTPYCDSFVSVVGKDHIFGVQFHPEKSQRIGFHLLRNFLSL